MRPDLLVSRCRVLILVATALGGTLQGARPAAANVSEGLWQSIATDHAPVPMSGHCVAFDSKRHRLLAYSGAFSYDARHQDLWALELTGAPRWTRISPTGNPPPMGAGTSMIFDPIGDRIILYGGINAGADPYQLNLSGAPVWSPLAAVGGIPPARRSSVAVYDPVEHQMIVFGGSHPLNGSLFVDAWALDLDGTPTWTPLVPLGSPGGRRDAHGILDVPNHRLVVFGGVNGAGVLNDTWALSISGTPRWTQLSGTGPSRFGGTAVYDAMKQRMLHFGGVGPLATCDGTPCWPHQSSIHALALVPGGEWTTLTPAAGPAPGTRAYLGGVVDADGRFVVFGGRTTSASDATNDAWIVPASNGASWLQFRPNLPRVDERRDAGVAWDPLRSRGLLFGGRRDVEEILDDVWALGGGSTEWERLDASVADQYVNRRRSGSSIIWDPVRDRMLAFGGQLSFGGDPTYGTTNSIIALDGATSVWSNLVTNRGPVERKWAAAAYDPVRDRMLAFAGYPVHNARNQLWALSLSASPTWTLLAPTGTLPGQGWGHTMTYDPKRDRMIVFGGGDLPSNKLWTLSLGAVPQWTAVNGPGTPPPARRFHSAIYDPVEDRLVVWGGQGQPWQFFADTWEYRFDGGGWKLLDMAASPPGKGSVGYYDPKLHRMVIFGGFDGDGFRRDTWALNLQGQTTGVSGAGTQVSLALHGAVPNPAFGAPRIALSLPDRAGATLELLDLAGRRVRTRDVGALGMGRHVVDLGGDGALAPGLYFARLTRAGECLTAKVCVAR